MCLHTISLFSSLIDRYSSLNLAITFVLTGSSNSFPRKKDMSFFKSSFECSSINEWKYFCGDFLLTVFIVLYKNNINFSSAMSGYILTSSLMKNLSALLNSL